jgi:hypothetical protein
MPPPPSNQDSRPSFEDDVAFLKRFDPVTVLSSDSGGGVAISPALGGRVMTSSVSKNGASLGWINHPFLEAKKTGTQFDNYGGEDRFWLGPEGGPFGLFFPKGAAYVFSAWQTPPGFNEGAWAVEQATNKSVALSRALHVANRAGTAFDVAASRTVSLLTRSEAAAALGTDISPKVQVVAFETRNVITNTGRQPWTKERGLLSIWILGMYAPSPDAHVLIPFDPNAAGDIVNDRYFGKVPDARLSVHAREGFLTFTCDGALRSKIGVGPARARSVIASYSPSQQLLTIVQFDHPKGASDYVNSMWEDQKNPYGGDVVNSYNDGPTEPGKPSLGGFYEVESSSPAAALAPGASLAHTHRTLHLVGAAADLEPIARRALGVSLEDFAK